MAEEKIIGIDLGTTNSVVRGHGRRRGQVIPNQEQYLTPSVVAFTDKGERVLATRPSGRPSPTRVGRFTDQALHGPPHKEVGAEEKLVPYKVGGGASEPRSRSRSTARPTRRRKSRQ